MMREVDISKKVADDLFFVQRSFVNVQIVFARATLASLFSIFP